MNRKQVLRGISNHIVVVHSQGPTTFWQRVTQRIAFRGDRFVAIVNEEEANNWLTLGRTTAEPPTDRFDPSIYPTEQCR
ncbi:MAG: hypothetical protein OT477_14750 [Chloroflexi bacterium]|nr:hypothetical protein [Chloroflexota bacterium]